MTSKQPIRIALFNHKGGVGKTTLTVNLAYALTRAGKKVLLVDSDPQCNLTSYLVGAGTVNKWLDESESAKGVTVWSGIRPVIQLGKPVETIEASERGDGVYLLPGDIKLSEYELELSQSWLDCLQRKIRGFLTTTALSTLVGMSASKVDAHFVFYDVGPNIGPLNRAILLDCDYFIVPAACDYFSTRALGTLGHTVAGWIRDWDLVAKLAPRDVPILRGKPIYLGYVLQRFRMYGGEIASTYKVHARQLEKHSHSDIVAVLREVNVELAPGSLSQFKLGQIKDFGTVASIGQEQGLPMSDVQGWAPYLREEARDSFDEFAERVLKRIGDINA